jgi:hypothetical protein
MAAQEKTIFLFSDGSLAFWTKRDRSFLDSTETAIENPSSRATVKRASDGNLPQSKQIREAAMDMIAIADRRMIFDSYAREEANFLSQTDLALLSAEPILNPRLEFCLRERRIVDTLLSPSLLANIIYSSEVN